MTPTELLRYLAELLTKAPIKRLCRTFRAEPEEAFGELYLRLANLATGKLIASPENWVFRNGFFLLRNLLRRELRPLTLQCAHEDYEETSADRLEIVSIVARELDRLPQSEKEAVQAYAGISQDSCRRVAKRWGVSTQTVCNRAKTAIRKLRPRLEGCR